MGWVRPCVRQSRHTVSAVTAPEQLLEALDERTLDILKRRRTGNLALRRRGWLLRRALIVADASGLIVAFLIAQAVYAERGGDSGALSRADEFLTFLASLPLWLIAANLYGLYARDEEHAGHSTADDFAGLFHLVTVCTFLLYAVSHLTAWFNPEFLKLFIFWSIAIVLCTALRVVARMACRRTVSYLQNTVIVGAGEVGQLVARKLLQHQDYGLNLVGFVDDAPRERRPDIGHLTVLGSMEDLSSLVDLLDVERVIVAFSKAPAEEEIRAIRGLEVSRVQVDVVPRLFEVFSARTAVHHLESIPLLSLRATHPSRASRAAKRVIDILGSALALLVAAPLLAYVAIRIRVDSPGPILFRQTRLGQDGREFTCLKFRSMRLGTDPSEHASYIARTADGRSAQEANGLFKLERDDVITPFGGWLRRSSLDELPQFINVLRGDMSLVGPRPCIPYELEYFKPHHFERFSVPAGITGLWQVTARANANFQEALDMDVAYARGWSLGLDLRLICQTPFKLLRSGATR